MIVIFDLDGTLCNIEHRLHYIQQDKKDWNGFFNACSEDVPIPSIINILKSLMNDGHHIWVWTGRSDVVITKTVDWIIEHADNIHSLKMREEGDHRPDTELKESWLKEDFPNGTHELMCVFEDRQQVVDMWRANGVVCCQVAKGDF